MNEREKEDQEQLEYLREWQAKHSGRAKKQIWCEKEKIRCFCHGCRENKAETPNGKCSGCNHCGKATEEKCLML